MAFYVPSIVSTFLQGVKAQINVETDYPFNEEVHFTVTTEQPVEFTLLLRIPDWCEEPVIVEQNIHENIQEKIHRKGFYRLKRIWEAETKFTLLLPMKVKLEGRPNDLVAITRGPLVYSLAIGERWVQINKDLEGREFPHCDYEVFPTTAWNYGLRVTASDLEQGLSFRSKAIGPKPFSPEGAPVSLTVKGSRIDWEQENGSATSVPSMKWISEEIEEIKLIPYGCTNLRMTEMPILI